ncbi:hypothetical protein OXIME_000794 [Oxyplasma meridianum]|uniref:Uncharacterized protein n=1 Tax=Oxyplasma meridianum TaxID=3073602 RepID=A0AAX4NHH5_9ARCH
MLIRDIDRKLDMRLVLKVRQATELFNVTSELDIKLPTYVYGVDGTSRISTYFPKILKGVNMMALLNRFNATEREDSYVVDSRINNLEDLAIIGKLIDLPSFVINRADMYRGFLNIYARFHSSQIDAVSDLVAQYTADSENARVEWLGPSQGIIRIMDLINSDYPVSILTYEFSLWNEDKNEIDLAHEAEIIGELKNSQDKDSYLRLVVYSHHVISNPINNLLPISTKDNIYEFRFSSPFLKSVRSDANKNHIMRLRHFVKPAGDKLRVTVFLPRSSMYEYYSLLYSKARKNDHGVTIMHLLPYSSDVWEFL